MIKGIIFDFDGLIFDTETHQYHILQEMFGEHGSELPLALWQNEIGTDSGFSPFHYMEEQIGKPVEHALLAEKYEEKFLSTLSLEKARDGVEDYLQMAKELELKIGLASSSSYRWVSGHLKNLDLYDYFHCIRTSDHVEKVKPDPALYIQAAQCLELHPEECLVFEDSAHGAMAAKRAGMGCVIVPNKVTHTMDFCEVEHRLDSMADMPLKDLIEYVSSLKADR
ncbi:HAD superfamily hydrolase (TIGR01509 family) [Planomicrobium stackebrandtii]|uniref:HAD superfamily hydrolase (TIGR01509 family) n=1 Tax=Planomicrobium stackebrandtii TaxID=253160 RepID=A0ABU0GXM9_9BACL|nr:HAD family hydrolase [Planomicrobium stackebrandtii]MDQ0429531.1 HAD superfamily hydrolase (TIGR01509 family) [Planomicrobium stackebrandtii]